MKYVVKIASDYTVILAILASQRGRNRNRTVQSPTVSNRILGYGKIRYSRIRLDTVRCGHAWVQEWKNNCFI